MYQSLTYFFNVLGDFINMTKVIFLDTVYIGYLVHQKHYCCMYASTLETSLQEIALFTKNSGCSVKFVYVSIAV